MSDLELPYQGVLLKTGETVYRPYVQVKFCYGKKSIKEFFTALVDSGADRCILDSKIADKLCIDYKTKGEKEEFLTPSGKTFGYRHKVIIAIKDGGKFATVATFVENYNRINLLGQTGFFDNYLVSFDKPKNKFYVRKIDS